MRSNSTVTKLASTANPAKSSKDNRVLWSKETERHVRASVALLLDDYEDDKALALVSLLELVANEAEFTDRDFMAHVARSEAFTYTKAFSKACQTFANKAKQTALATAA